MLTLHDILSWDILSGHSVIAGAAGLGAEVRSLTVIDAPDAVNWVKAREFVVTSTFPVHDDPEALALLVEQLAARDAAGLGVKLTRFLRAVPENALARAEALGVPIISLPGGLAWSDLIGAIFGQIGEAATVAHLSTIYRGFSQHRDRIDSPAALFDLLSSFVGLPLLLALEDESGLSTMARDLPQATAEMLAERLLHADPSDDGPSRLHFGGMDFTMVHTGVTASGAGVVAVMGETVSEPDLECLRLALPLMHGLLARSAHAGLPEGDRLLADLLDPVMPARARSLLLAGHQPGSGSWHLTAARIFATGDVDPSRLMLRLRQFLRRHRGMMRLDPSGEYLMAFPATPDDPRADAVMLRDLEQIWQRQAEMRPAFRYGLGQAGPGDLAREGITLRHEALEALGFGTRLNGFNRLHRHEDLLLLRLLAQPAVIGEARLSLRRLIAPLLEAGEAGEALIETLRIWLLEDESIPRTAARMGLHPNSVRHRLERIRQILGLTDFGTATKLRLHVALQLLPVLDAEGPARGGIPRGAGS